MVVVEYQPCMALTSRTCRERLLSFARITEQLHCEMSQSSAPSTQRDLGGVTADKDNARAWLLCSDHQVTCIVMQTTGTQGRGCIVCGLVALLNFFEILR